MRRLERLQLTVDGDDDDLLLGGGDQGVAVVVVGRARLVGAAVDCQAPERVSAARRTTAVGEALLHSITGSFLPPDLRASSGVPTLRNRQSSAIGALAGWFACRQNSRNHVALRGCSPQPLCGCGGIQRSGPTGASA